MHDMNAASLRDHLHLNNFGGGAATPHKAKSYAFTTSPTSLLKNSNPHKSSEEKVSSLIMWEVPRR